MTCDDARALLSALIDDALSAGERTACEAHLAACPDCTRELARLRATVSLVRAIGPARAPAGFADRVVSAARAEPRPRRSTPPRLRGWPLGVPLSAVAAVLVAVIGVSLYRLTPELREAARRGPAEQGETRTTGPSSSRPPAVTTAPPATPPPDSAARAPRTSPESSPRATAPVTSAATPSTQTSRADAPATTPPPAATGVSPAPAAPEASPAPAAPGASPAPAAPAVSDLAAEREARALSDAQSPRQHAAKAASRQEQNATPPQAPAPSRDRVPPQAMEPSLGRTSQRSVEARLVAASLAGGEQAVIDVVSRLQARLVTRREDGDSLTLTIDVPSGAYTELTRALSESGRFTVLGDPGTSAEPIRMILRITR